HERYATTSELGRAFDAVARELGAATEEEVVAFLRDVLGDRQEQRNETLRVALRSADDRAAERRAAHRELGVFSYMVFTSVTSVTVAGLGGPSDGEATGLGSGRPAITSQHVTLLGVSATGSESAAIQAYDRRVPGWFVPVL